MSNDRSACSDVVDGESRLVFVGIFVEDVGVGELDAPFRWFLEASGALIVPLRVKPVIREHLGRGCLKHLECCCCVGFSLSGIRLEESC